MSADLGHESTYFRAMAGFDARAATGVVLKLWRQGFSAERITTEVLAPAQVRVGELWQSGAWSVADEHAATSITEGALTVLSHAAAPRSGSSPQHVAVACPEGEWHGLPARMAAAVMSASGGARVTMLGASLPAEHLRRRLEAGDVDVLALSCTMPTNLIGAARCIAAAHAAHVPVVVGGRAFGRTSLRAESIGADGWSDTPTAVLGALPDLHGHDVEIAPEVLFLDAIDDATISLAYDRMLGAFPELSSMSPYQLARTREDLVWMARYTAAALLTGDASIVEELLTWLRDFLDGKVPASVITTAAYLLAETLEPQAPSGAALLAGAADTSGAVLTATAASGTDL